LLETDFLDDDNIIDIIWNKLNLHNKDGLFVFKIFKIIQKYNTLSLCVLLSDSYYDKSSILSCYIDCIFNVDGIYSNYFNVKWYILRALEDEISVIGAGLRRIFFCLTDDNKNGKNEI